MPRPLFDSPYIFGIHEPGGEKQMLEAGKPGWIIFTEEIGHNPNDSGGKNFTPWSNQGLGILCRLNNGYEPNGTIPHSRHYEDFARRCARYVAASQGCKVWIIGNEMNFHVERPEASRGRGGSRGASRSAGQAGEPQPSPREDPNRFNAFLLDAPPEPTRSFQPLIDGREVITPQLYARCYRLCRDAIHALPGHADDLVLIGSVAPWNAQTQYPENGSGDWILYFRHILEQLGPGQCDGITIHTYTRDAQPGSITSNAKMGSFPQYSSSFQTYRDFMKAIPKNMSHLPVYITETDQNEPWEDRNNGWVQEAYREIDRWNQTPGNQQIRALILYRWPQKDKWVIETKGEVVKDFQSALHNDFRWRETATPAPPVVEPAPFKLGQRIYAISGVYVRQTPGYQGKPAGDVLMTAPGGTEFQDVSGPQMADRLPWWRVRCTVDGQSYLGWAAQATPSGFNLLSATAPPKPAPEPVPPTPEPEPPKPPATPTLSVGSQVVVRDEVSLRRSPGFRNKPAGDILYDMPAGSQVTIIDGPKEADGLTWWSVRFISQFDNRFAGWTAQATASGTPLLAPEGSGTAPQEPDQPSPSPAPPASRPALSVGGKAVTQNTVVLRKSPGWQDKPADDILYEIAAGQELEVIDGPRQVDGLTWWGVRYTSPAGNRFSGWAAQATASGAILLAPAGQAEEGKPAPPDAGKLSIGSRVKTLDALSCRRSPGFRDKPAGDVIYEIPSNNQATILEGPRSADGLVWWRIRHVAASGAIIEGWNAEASASGAKLLELVAKTPDDVEPGSPFRVGEKVYTMIFLNIRRSPGYVGKSGDDVLDEAPFGAQVPLVSGPQSADDLVWWQIRYVDGQGNPLLGWVAQANSKGQFYLSRTQPTAPPLDEEIPIKAFKAGNVIFNIYSEPVNVRRTAGFANKADSDIAGKLPYNEIATIVAGPRTADGLTWWQIRGTVDGKVIEGWVAEVGAMGERFLAPAQIRGLPALGKPFEGKYRVTQYFGSRPEAYAVFNLKGHNGIDFATPTGTKLLATDDGEVVQADFDKTGYGNYVKLKHVWGESIYGHMQKFTVKVGDKVARGEELGMSDNTGNSTGAHLHFSIRIFPYNRADGWSGCCDPAPLMNVADLSSRGPGGPQAISDCVGEETPGRIRP